MVICGIQKLTLLDYPGKVACTIFTGGCNFRCPFCHNRDLVTGEAEERLDPEQGLLDYVAMDLKNSPEHYGRTVGEALCDVERIDRSIRLLMGGDIPYEFRTTVVRELHQRADFEAMGKWIEGADQYFLQQFVDSGHVLAPGLHAYDKKILLQALEIVKRYVKTAQLRGI